METTALALKAFALALKASRGFAPPIAMEPYFNPMEMWRRILAMVIYVTKRLTPLVTGLVPPLPLMFNQKSTLQAQLRGIPNEPKDPSDSTSQASWDILDAVEMESSHQREITPESQDMSSGEITPEIYLMMGTPPLCLHRKGAQLAVSRSRNEKTLYWMCPLQGKDRCDFFAWTEHQPLIKRTDHKVGCNHLYTTKAGTNAFKIQKRCLQCRKIIFEEKTALGAAKALEKISRNAHMHRHQG